jgi:hypothetical protein
MSTFATCTASVNVIALLSDLPNDTDGLTSAQLKARFDQAGSDIKTFINSSLISQLENSSSTASSGASRVGFKSAYASDLQNAVDYIYNAGSGTIPPDASITNAKLVADIKVGSLASVTSSIADTSSVVAVINESIGDTKTSISSVTGSLATLTASVATHTASTGHLDVVLTTQGDIAYRDGTGPQRLPKGTAYNALIMNSGETAPSWASSLQSLIAAAGDIIYGSAANTPAKLAKGSDGQFLGLSSGVPQWQTPVQSAYGTYSGDDTNPRNIALGIWARFLILHESGTNQVFITFLPLTYGICLDGSGYGYGATESYPYISGTNLVVSTGHSNINQSGKTYSYYAIG